MPTTKNRLFASLAKHVNNNSELSSEGLSQDARVGDVLAAVNANILPAVDSAVSLGDSTSRFKDLYLSGNTIYLGNTTFSETDVLPFDLTIQPEVLEIQADAPDSGVGTRWLWTWEQSTLPYARTAITNEALLNVPLYEQGTYTVNNFAYSIHGNMSQTHNLYLKWIDGAGTDNLVSWVSYDSASASHPDIDSGNTHTIQQLSISVPSTITPPTLTAPSVAYTVSNNGAGAYTFTGVAVGDNPTIGPLRRGGTYTFNVNASGHPFYITTDNGANFSAGNYIGEYTNGVTNSRTQTGTLTFVVPDAAPDTLYYQCGNHGAMRGVINVKDLEVERNVNGRYVVYFQHTQEGHKQAVELKGIPSLVNQMCIVYDNTTNQFVPQDLATYVDNTPSFKEKIKEVAGTATLIAPDGVPVVATVTIVADASYLPYSGNDTGDLAYSEDTQTMYVWNGSSWNATRPPTESSFLQLNQSGVLETITGDVRWTAPKDINISSVEATVGTAPTGSSIIATLNKNGTVISTLTIGAGSTSVTNSNLAISVLDGDYLTIDVTQIGSTVAGSDLNVIITYT